LESGGMVCFWTLCSCKRSRRQTGDRMMRLAL
jgi:hypothetical protein